MWNMRTVAHEVVIEASPEDVYQVSQDYSVRYEWDPFPERIELMHGATAIEEGGQVFVHARSGFTMEVEFVQVSPVTTAIKMTKGPFFLEAFAGSWVFKPHGEYATRARFVYSIKARAWTLRPLSEPVMRWYFAAVVRRRLEGLKAYCERRASRAANLQGAKS
jgi:hypothetical protein